jgi:WD40 repeat protein
VPLANLSWAGYCELTPDGRSLVFTQVQHRQQGGQILLSRRSISDLGRTEWSVELSDSPLSQPLFLAGGERFLLFGSWFDMHPFRSGPVYETRDPRTGAVVSEVRLEGEQYHHPVLSADRRRIAARRTKHIAVFHADDLSVPPVVLHNDNRKEYTGLAFHPSGRYLAATSNDSTVKFYDTSTWQMMHAFDWDIGRLRSIAFSPDGMLAAAGGDKGKIVIWDVDV